MLRVAARSGLNEGTVRTYEADRSFSSVRTRALLDPLYDGLLLELSARVKAQRRRRRS
jgi:hypothetical protein